MDRLEDPPELVRVRRICRPNSLYSYVVVMSHASTDDLIQPLSKCS